MNLLNKNTYSYELPEELIAQTPVEPRDQSRLLAFDIESEKIEHKKFFQIEEFLRKGDVLVINNTRVLPARLYGEKKDTKAKIEILLQKRIDLARWEIIAKPAKRLKINSEIFFSDYFSCVCMEKKENGNIIAEFRWQGGTFETNLDKSGETPMPHYIKEKLSDKERYQTVYSKVEGSSAAPTAGLHFTKELLQKLQDNGVIIANLTLHVGLGTFRPVKEENILNHEMHSETFYLSEETAEIINKAIKENRRIIAVGTTSVRVLETCADEKGFIKAASGETNIFIYPPYKFKIVDAIITNFHLPESTLIMLISAFCGVENVKKVYSEAIKEKYRFYSFGDACFFY